MTQFNPSDDAGTKDLVSKRDVILEADSDQDGDGDIILRTGGVERARIDHAGVGTGWANVLGGSMPAITTSVTRDASGRVTAFTDDSGSYTVGYDSATGLTSTVSNGTTTRTISRDASGLVTGVA